MEWIIGIWLIAVFVAGFNLCAAGMAAILHAWRSKMRRRGRIAVAAAVAGFLPASTILVIGEAQDSYAGISGEPLIAALAFGALFVVATILSLPGAWLVARKLDSPGHEYRAFE